ncbi:MAG: PilN domain-containing protein [Betaproteobacteria bacterium]|nr:PilN domain-containing protein [Betaproteobacteria bacterium]
MIRINLLPHREEKRKARRTQFYTLAALVLVLAALVVLLIYSIWNGYIGEQESKNEFLRKEIAILDARNDQIKRLKEQMQALLARKEVIESLQSDRSEAVHLLGELTKSVPDGVYLKSIKQEGRKVSVTGYAQSNSRVSSLMRNLESSPWMASPQLMEIKAVTVDKRRLNEFVLVFQLKRSLESAAKAGAAMPVEAKP